MIGNLTSTDQFSKYIRSRRRISSCSSQTSTTNSYLQSPTHHMLENLKMNATCIQYYYYSFCWIWDLNKFAILCLRNIYPSPQRNILTAVCATTSTNQRHTNPDHVFLRYLLVVFLSLSFRFFLSVDVVTFSAFARSKNTWVIWPLCTHFYCINYFIISWFVWCSVASLLTTTMLMWNNS